MYCCTAWGVHDLYMAQLLNYLIFYFRSDVNFICIISWLALSSIHPTFYGNTYRSVHPIFSRFLCLFLVYNPDNLCWSCVFAAYPFCLSLGSLSAPDACPVHLSSLPCSNVSLLGYRLAGPLIMSSCHLLISPWVLVSVASIDKGEGDCSSVRAVGAV